MGLVEAGGHIHDVEAPTVRFWGVRGSIPVPGSDTATYGGNTTCLEIGLPGISDAHAIIVDAGTGLFGLGCGRDWTRVERVDLLLSHLHLDHVIGLPFFKAMFVKNLDISIWCGNLGGETAESALRRVFSPPLFPVALEDFPANIRFIGFRSGDSLAIGPAAIRTAPLNHPSGATGFRFDAGSGSLAIVTDIEHCQGNPDPVVVDLCRDVDTLVYDAMLEDCDYGRCKGWGHSTIPAGLALASAAGARRLVGCHHAPEHDDGIMAERERRLRMEWPAALMAREGMKLVCAPSEQDPTRDQAAAAGSPAMSTASAAGVSQSTR